MASTGVTKMAAVIFAIMCLIHCACSLPAQSLRERRDALEMDSSRSRRAVGVKMPWALDALKQELYSKVQTDKLRKILENESKFALAGRK